MPLGDSLTDGYNIPGGYRTDLWSRLNADGLSFGFGGSLANGPTSLPDKDPEGNSGWRIDEIASSVQTWLNAYQPQVIFLLIGTNDVTQDYELAGAPAGWPIRLPPRCHRLI
jgi:lysophospholipase L1-like esterase